MSEASSPLDVRTRGAQRSPAGGDATGSRSVGFTISTTGFAIGRAFRELLAPLGLEPREFALLRTISASEGRSQQQLAESLGVPASRMVAHIYALQARGLVQRRPNPDDRRAHEIHLTDDGRRLLARATKVASRHDRDLCTGLSAAERRQLLELLDRVGAALGIESRHAHSALRDP